MGPIELPHDVLRSGIEVLERFARQETELAGKPWQPQGAHGVIAQRVRRDHSQAPGARVRQPAEGIDGLPA